MHVSHSSADELFGWFLFLAIVKNAVINVNNAVINVDELISLWDTDFKSLRHIPKNNTAL